MRKLITAFKTSVDLKIEGPDGFADWVDAWSEDYGLTDRIDACLLGAVMYRGYEQYWTAIQNHRPGEPLPMTGKLPTEAEIAWARFAAHTPHYVLSNSVEAVNWPSTVLLRHIDDIAALKQKPGKDIYLMGGAQLASSLCDAGLVDEIHLRIHPLLAGAGKPLFAANTARRELTLVEARPLDNGLVSLIYAVG